MPSSSSSSSSSSYPRGQTSSSSNRSNNNNNHNNNNNNNRHYDDRPSSSPSPPSNALLYTVGGLSLFSILAVAYFFFTQGRQSSTSSSSSSSTPTPSPSSTTPSSSPSTLPLAHPPSNNKNTNSSSISSVPSSSSSSSSSNVTPSPAPSPSSSSSISSIHLTTPSKSTSSSSSSSSLLLTPRSLSLASQHSSTLSPTVPKSPLTTLAKQRMRISLGGKVLMGGETDNENYRNGPLSINLPLSPDGGEGQRQPGMRLSTTSTASNDSSTSSSSSFPLSPSSPLPQISSLSSSSSSSSSFFPTSSLSPSDLLSSSSSFSSTSTPSDSQLSSYLLQSMQTLQSTRSISGVLEQNIGAWLYVCNMSQLRPQTRLFASQWLILYSQVDSLRAKTQYEYENSLERAIPAMHHAYNLLDCDHLYDEIERNAADLLRLDILQRLREGDKMLPIFIRILSRTDLSIEEISVAFTAAPLLGCWNAMSQLGERIKSMGGDIEQYHVASLTDRTTPDYKILFDYSEDEGKIGDMESEYLQWESYNIKSIQIRLKEIRSNEEKKAEMVAREIEVGGGGSVVKREWKIYPLSGNETIFRHGGFIQLDMKSSLISALINGASSHSSSSSASLSSSSSSLFSSTPTNNMVLYGPYRVVSTKGSSHTIGIMKLSGYSDMNISLPTRQYEKFHLCQNPIDRDIWEGEYEFSQEAIRAEIGKKAKQIKVVVTCDVKVKLEIITKKKK